MSRSSRPSPLSQSLALAGFSPREAAFYLAAIQLGRAPIRQVALRARLNRTSAYSVCEALKVRGLVSVVKRTGKAFVEPLAPQRLLERQQDGLASLERSIEELATLFRIAQKEPGVTFYEGEDGLKAVLQSILDEANEVCIFGDGDAFKRAVPGWTEAYAATRSRRGIRARLLLRGTPEVIASIKKERTTGKKDALTKVRVLPEALNIVGGFDAYDQKTVLYSFEAKTVAVVIDSPVISRMMKSVFEILWSLAETYEKTLLR